jgi:HK97 gp10 family phage protein
MKLINWNPDLASDEITKTMMNRLEKAAELVATRARQNVPVGKDRPPYKTGKEWTARKAGALKKSIRVVRLKGDPKLNIRVYAGNSGDVYYAHFVEYGTAKMAAKPFMRPALSASKSDIKTIMENG